MKCLNPEPLLKTLRRFKVSAHETVYIGDMEEDVLAAKEAGVKSVFVKGKNEKEDYHADYSIKKISEIPKLIKKKLWL